MKANMKPKFCLLLLIFLGTGSNSYSQVGVNILNPHPSAAMQIQSPAGSFKGLLTPSMTTVDRMNASGASPAPADGLIVYDVNHKMHYCFNSSSGRWVSMSPFTLSTPSVGSVSYPSGVITTPATSVPTTFSVGINKQNPSQALDVVGNATITGNVRTGGTSFVAGSSTVTGNSIISGSINVAGFATNAMVPTGAIIMWSGTLVPVGWAVCDGGTYNGLATPDLRGRFIIGMNNSQGAQVIPTGQYVALGASGLTPAVAPNDGQTINYGAIGNTGGEIGHALSLSEMPTHTHNVTAAFINNNVFGFNAGGAISIGNGTAASGNSQVVSATIGETPRGSNQIHENRPPYYVLAYIIKLP